MPPEVTYDEEKEYQRQRPESALPRGLIGFVIRMGLAKDEEGANRVLLGVAAVAVVLAAVIPFFFTSTPEPYAPQAKVDAALTPKVIQYYHSYAR